MFTLPDPTTAATTLRDGSGWARLPGLAATAVATAASFALATLVPGLNATTAAVVLGVLAVNIGVLAPATRPGLAFATTSLLRVAVVLLGLQLSVPQLRHLGASGLEVVALTVLVTFFGTQLVARMLGVSRPLGLLVATGFSICGASAIAGMQPVAGGDEDDTRVAVTLVTLCGSLAIIVLPLLRVPLGLDYTAFGSWAGASVHDVGQTVATANRVGHGALEPAIVVKLTRVVLLAPLAAGVALSRRRSMPAPGKRRPVPVPLFVLGFLAAITVRSTGLVPRVALTGAAQVQQLLLAAALFALGSGVSWTMLRRTGGRPLVLGLVSWVLVASVAYLGARLTGA
jgi:uncharacterized integral membrane protein (TIGR00698 family)